MKTPSRSPSNSRHGSPLRTTPFRTTPSKAKITYLSRTPNRSSPAGASTSKPIFPTSPAHKTSLARSDTLILDGPEQTLHMPVTPKKPAKDLSWLFDFSPSKTGLQSTATGRDSGIAKRMLSRSRLESSVISESGSGSQDAISSQSQPDSPFGSLLSKVKADSPLSLASNSVAARAQTPAKDQAPRNWSLEDATSPSPSPSPSKHQPITSTHARTYAGKSRSFLVELPTSHLSSLDQSGLDVQVDAEPDGFGQDEVRESYADLRERWGVDNSDDDPRPVSPSPSPRKGTGKASAPPQASALPNGMMNDLKSITELRSKGESRRFLDEVGYLFEGMEPNTAIGVRRAR